jgi:hypothetical protein
MRRIRVANGPSGDAVMASWQCRRILKGRTRNHNQNSCESWKGKDHMESQIAHGKFGTWRLTRTEESDNEPVKWATLGNIYYQTGGTGLHTDETNEDALAVADSQKPCVR